MLNYREEREESLAVGVTGEKVLDYWAEAKEES